MSLVIFGDGFSFPEGDASTNRMLTYARGFTEFGETVYVICFLSKYKLVPNGTYKGVKYFNVFSYENRSPNPIVRLWRNFLKYIRTIQLLRKINKEDKIIAINCETYVTPTYYFSVFLSKFLKTKLLIECSEHPLRFNQGNYFNRLIGKIKFYFEAHACDGALCISNYLIDFYKSYGVKERHLLLMQSTVDTERFAQKTELNLPYHYIGYFGSLSFQRDNVDLLIRAFARIHPKHPDIRLTLGGFATPQEIEEMHDLINSLNIKDSVTVLKYLPREEVVQHILNSYLLVMVRNKNLESEASYPSKLTEYLSTGIPVISVSIGDIPLYIKDKENAFLIEPGDEDQLVEQIDYVLSNYSNAIEVGKKGKLLTETIFNYKTQCDKLYQFIKSLN